jgi:hypothetical protein
MGAFGGLIITNKGIALQAKVQAGAELHFTRIGVGDGTLGGQSIPTLTNLISEKMSLDITKLKVLGGGKAVVGGVLSNLGITTGFYFREIGVFAMDPDEGEILYCYGNAGSGAEYIPPGGGPDVIEKQIDIVTIIGNASNVSAEIPSAVYATVDQLEAHINATTGVHGATSVADPNTLVQRDAAGRFKAAAPVAADDVARKAEVDAHASRTDNPHAVTKAQVGLGSVDNYPTASQAEAEAGTAANRFMTPQRTKQYVDTRLQNGLTLREHNGTVERWNQQKGEWEPVAAVFPVGRLRGATLSLTSEQNNAYYTVLDISGVSGRLEFVQAQVSNNGPGHVFYMRVTVDGKSDEFSAQSNTTANMSLNYLVRPYGGANNLVGDVSDPIYFQNSVKVEIKKTGAALSATVRYRLAAGTP